MPGCMEAHPGGTEAHNRDPERRNLMYFWISQNLNCQKAHWSLFLSIFEFSLTHRPGEDSTKPDSLLHWEDHQTKEHNNPDQMMLSAEKFHGSSELRDSLAANGDDPSCVTLEDKEANFLKWVHNCTD